MSDYVIPTFLWGIEPYIFVASPWEAEGSAICSIWPFSSDTPLLEKHYKITEEGGEEKSLELMVNILKTVPENQGLHYGINRTDEGKNAKM